MQDPGSGSPTSILFVSSKLPQRDIPDWSVRITEKDIPAPTDGRAVAHWIVARAALRGDGHILLPDGSMSAEATNGTLLGTVACFTDKTYLCAVLSENSGDLGAWLRAPLRGLAIETIGKKGLRTKRPEKLILRGTGLELLLQGVDSLNLARMRSSAGQETELLAALTRAPA